MTSRLIKWTAGFLASAALHAGAVGIFLTPDGEVQVAGGQPTELAILGNALEDQVSAGDVAEAVSPSETEAVEPAETAQDVAALQPEAVQPRPPIEPTPPTETEAIRPEPVDEATAVPPLPPETPKPVATPAEPVEDAVPVEPEAVPVQEQEDVAAVEPETLAPLPEDELALVDVPIPTPRPAYTPPPPPKRAEKPREQPQQVARQQPGQGSGGQNQTDSKRGAEQGAQAGAGATAEGQGARATAAGNAAVSNYPGQIVTRLRRSLRYPRAAQREGIRGEVHVRFTVAGSGQVTAMSVARSSGSPVLDEAALATVQRAAPFPAIPAAAGRNSWPFTVPLVFSN